MKDKIQKKMVALDTDEPIWEHVFMVHPLIVVGTREPDGSYNFSPKHMAMPLGWQNYFGCIGTPQHRTYHNIVRERVFTVSFPNPEQVVSASLTATARNARDHKLILDTLPTIPAQEIDGAFLKDSYLCLECELERIIDGFGEHCLIAARIVAAHAQECALRGHEKDDNDIVFNTPLLGYLHPGRCASIRESYAFPFPTHFKR